MKISELKIGQSRVDIEAEVKSIEEPRTFSKFGREVRVTNALIEDDSGSVKLTLWNQDIENVKVGDKVKITNGFVNEFNGEKQLTSGKFGKLEVSKSKDFDDSQKQNVSEVLGKGKKQEKTEETEEKSETEVEESPEEENADY